MAILIDYIMPAFLRIVIVALVVPASVIIMMSVPIALVLIVMNLRPIIVTMVHVVLLLFIGSMSLLQIIMLYLGLCSILRMESGVVAVLMRLELLHPAGRARVMRCVVWLVKGVSFLFGAATVAMVGVSDDVLVGVVVVVIVFPVDTVDDRLVSRGVVVLVVQRAVLLVMTVRISMMVNSVVHLFVMRFSCWCRRC